MRKGTKSIAFFKILFVGLLLLPTVWMLFGGGTLLENSEKRELATFPSLADSVEAFPKAFEKYFNDHFGGRNELVFATNLFKVTVLQSSHTDDVLVGKNGWRFLNKPHMVKDYRGVARLDTKQLAAIQYRFELMDSIVSSYGGKFIVVIAPNKQSIYPEYLPWTMQQLNDTTRLDQLTAHMNANSEVAFLNLVPALLKGKEETKVYLTTDTHWSHKGAYFGFAEIVRALYGVGTKAHDLGNPPTEIQLISGDLNGMLGFAGTMRESTEVLAFFNANQISFSEETYNMTKFTRAFNKEGSGEKLLFYNDSFGAGLRDFFYNLFTEVYVAKNKQIDVAFIANAKADVVIFEIVERQIPFFASCKVIRE